MPDLLQETHDLVIEVRRDVKNMDATMRAYCNKTDDQEHRLTVIESEHGMRVKAEACQPVMLPKKTMLYVTGGSITLGGTFLYFAEKLINKIFGG